MKYRLTFLNIAAFLFILYCIVTTLFRYDTLSKEGGWGVIAMMGLTAYAITALVVDLVIQWQVKGRLRQLFVSAIALLLYILSLLVFR